MKQSSVSKKQSAVSKNNTHLITGTKAKPLINNTNYIDLTNNNNNITNNCIKDYNQLFTERGLNNLCTSFNWKNPNESVKVCSNLKHVNSDE